jgi:regulator of sigma E protease
MSILIFLGILCVLVLVHELGHFAVAKWSGMRVDEFGIGFPPKLFGIRFGETEYTLNLFPVGGFVRIHGEDSEGDTTGAPDPRSFVAKNKWAQSAVLVAGVFMNVLIAWIIIVTAFMVGVQSSVTEADATEKAALTIAAVLPDSPAAKAEIPAGAVIQQARAGDDTLGALNPSTFSAFIEAHSTAPISLAFSHNGELHLATILPVQGLIADDVNKSAIGVSLVQVEVVKRSFGKAIGDATIYTGTALRDIAVGIGSLFYDAIRFKADFSQVAGPVGIVGLVGDASTQGATTLLMFTAFISLNLAVINILPFPALDGGRLLFVGIEAITRRPIPARYVQILNSFGFLLLILMMVAVTWNDIARIL